jgi:predicted RecA/RadA family phage recombinase
VLNRTGNGTTMPWTNNTGSDVVSGQLVNISGGYCGVAAVDIADGETGTLELVGVYRFSCSTAGFAQGIQAETGTGTTTLVAVGAGGGDTITNGRIQKAVTTAETTAELRLF